MSEPDEAKELRLVNNVELKLALANSDAQLQKLLNLYLAPLLLKLASPHQAVRNKVISVCQHINTRTKSGTVVLPVAALLAQFQDPAVGGAHPLVRNFDLMYITTGIDRIPISERLELLPTIVRGISKHGNDHHHRSLFNVLLRLLLHFVPPSRGTKEDLALRAKFGFDENPQDAEWLSKWFSKLMLLNLNIFSSVGPAPMEVALHHLVGAHGSVARNEADPAAGRCPGLLSTEIDFLTLGRKKETFSPASVLADQKMAVLKFLASGAFADYERFFPTLIASVDSNSAVSGPADDIFKRASASVSLDDQNTVRELYSMVLGGPGLPAVKPQLQVKVLNLMSKSRTAVEAGRERNIEDIVNIGVREEYTKLRQASFEFAMWAARMGSDDLMHKLAPEISGILQRVLPSEDLLGTMAGYAYETYGTVVSRCMPLVLEPKLQIVQFLFRRLKDCPGSVAGSVERAMGVILTKVTREKIVPDVKSALEDLILDTVVDQSRASGQAVKWAGRVLGFGSTIGRWVAVLAVEMGGTLGEEGAKALHPYYYRLANPRLSVSTAVSTSDTMDVDHPTEEEDLYAFPGFYQTVSYFFLTPHTIPDRLQQAGAVDGILPPTSFATALAFCKRVAYWEALVQYSLSTEIKIDEDWERTVDSAIATDPEARGAVEKFFASQLESNLGAEAVQRLMHEAWAAMIYDNEGIEGVKETWNELAVLLPADAMAQFVPHLIQVQKLLKVPKATTRRAAAFAVGLAASDPNLKTDTLTALLRSLVEDATSGKHGPLLALGFLLSRLQVRGRLDVVEKDLINNAAKAVSNALTESRDGMTTEAAVEALTELEASSVIDKDTVDPVALAKVLEERAKKGDERSLTALAFLAFLFPEDSKEACDICDQIIKLGESGGVETAFSAGEAACNCAAGWTSSAVRRGRTLAGVSWTGVRRSVGKLLEQTLKKAGEPAGGGKRRATCVTLLSIIEFCGEDPDVHKNLKQAQQAFRTFLADRDEFVQESAARGLTAVYNLSDEETRSALVRDLVSSFTGEKKDKMTVSRDTQLFEPGQLPTEEGKSVGSYGDIMSLAAELGDPSLVYKFMALAKHNSVWASRAAFGRFGLGGILSSSIEVKENKKLWPTIFRYKHDPNPSVRQSMQGIWEALGGSAETVEKWWKEIADECLKSAVDREWRVREASLAALAELLSGRKVTQYKEKLKDIWMIAFKVIDDIKESVRLAAMKLCKVLTTNLVRAVEGENISQKEKKEILEGLMGFLMGRQGLEADAKETQIFAIDTLLKIVKKGGSTLRPWVPALVSRLIMLLSDVESGAVNYLHLNADKYGTTGEDIDRQHLAIIRQSPIMSTLEELLDILDADTIASLVPELTRCIRTSIGFPSKVGCSRVVVSLVMRRPTILRPYADQLLPVCTAAVKDRSETASATYAAAAGYLCRLASDKAVLKLMDWADKAYWEGEEPERKSIGRVISEIYKNATDHANAFAVSILPFVFVAKHDGDKGVREEFTKTWSENTGGTGAVKLYLTEIVQIATEHLGSARWMIKQTCALALAEAAKAIGSDITKEQVEKLWGVLVTAVGGKSWEGKERVLDAFVIMAVNGNRFVEDDDAKMKELEKIVIREAKRNNPTYRSAAIKSLGAFVDGFSNVNLFDSVYAVVEAALSPPDEDEMDVDDPNDRSSRKAQDKTVIHGMTALSKAFRPNLLDTGSTRTNTTKILDLLDKHATGSSIDIKSTSVEVTVLIVRRLSVLKSGVETLDVLLERLWERLLQTLTDPNYESGRIKAAAGVEHFSILLPSGPLLAKIQTDVGKSLSEEKSPMVLQVLEPAAQTLSVSRR